MLKLSWSQRLRLFIGQHRRGVWLAFAGLLAVSCTIFMSLSWSTAVSPGIWPWVLLVQLVAGAIITLLVLVLTD